MNDSLWPKGTIAASVSKQERPKIPHKSFSVSYRLLPPKECPQAIAEHDEGDRVLAVAITIGKCSLVLEDWQEQVGHKCPKHDVGVEWVD